MKRRFLSLTRTRLLSALCWAVVLAAGLTARFFPVAGLPLPLRMAVAGVLAVLAAVIVVTSLGVFTEKGDERSAENERRADAALFTLFFLAMGALLFLTKDGWALTLGRAEVLVLFAVVCLARDLLFLAYERLGGGC